MKNYFDWSSGRQGIITHSILAIVSIILSIVIMIFAWASSMPTAYSVGQNQTSLWNFGLIIALCALYCFVISSIGLFRFLKSKDKSLKTVLPKVMVVLAGMFVIPPFILASMLFISAINQTNQVKNETSQENELSEQESVDEEEKFLQMNRDELVDYAKSVGIQINDSLSTEMIREKIIDITTVTPKAH